MANITQRRKPSSIYEAIQQQNTAAAISFIDTITDIKDGNKAMWMACEYEMTAVAIKLITSKKANAGYVNVNDDKDNSILIVACANSKLHGVALALIRTGESRPDYANADGNTALLSCLLSNYAPSDKRMVEAVATALIKTGESNPGQVNENGHTALFLACYNSIAPVAELLIETGQADIGRVSDDSTALMITCSNLDNVEMAEIALKLIASGQSNPGQTSDTGYTALLIGLSRMTEKWNVRKDIRVDAILALIDTGESNPNQITNDGRSALGFACKNQNAKIALKLLETGQVTPDVGASLIASNNQMTAVVEKINQIMTMSVDASTTGFDYITHTEVPIYTHMNGDPSNLVFAIKTDSNVWTYYLTNKDVFTNANIRYECIKAGTLNPDNILRDNPLYALKPTGVLVDFIRYMDAAYLLHTQNTLLVLTPRREVASVANADVIERPGQTSIVSAAHCQEGQGGTLYTVAQYNINFTGNLPTPLETPIAAPSTNQVTTNYREQKTVFPVTADTTVGQIAQALAEKMSIDSQRITFIYGGRRLDNAALIMQLQGFDHGITLLTQIRALGGGTKRRHKRNKRKSKGTRLSRHAARVSKSMRR